MPQRASSVAHQQQLRFPTTVGGQRVSIDGKMYIVSLNANGQQALVPI